MSKLFKQFDTDKDGKLSKKELVRALRSLPKKKPKKQTLMANALLLAALTEAREKIVKAFDRPADGRRDLR